MDASAVIETEKPEDASLKIRLPYFHEGEMARLIMLDKEILCKLGPMKRTRFGKCIGFLVFYLDDHGLVHKQVIHPTLLTKMP